MTITEKQLGEFFPRDMRFTHYVAKTYGYTFRNNDAAEKANSIAMDRVLKLYNDKMEFDSKEHLYGYVMSTIRFAIMSSFNTTAAEKNLNIRNESDLTYGEEGDEYSLLERAAVVDGELYDDTVDSLIDIMKRSLTNMEFTVFEMKYKRDFSKSQISQHTGISEFAVQRIKESIKRKFNKIIEKIDEDGYYERKAEKEFKQKEAIKKANIESYRQLRRETRNKRIEENKIKRSRSAKAMSWIDIDPQV